MSHWNIDDDDVYLNRFNEKSIESLIIVSNRYDQQC
jgi:hypothetical protein